MKLKRTDIIIYILKIRLNFENAYPTTGDRELDLLVESWYDCLCDYPKEACDAAVNNCLKRAKFAPRLGDITEEIETLLHPDRKSDEELWAELCSVLGKVYDLSRYLTYPQHYKRAYAKLSEIYSALSEDLKLYIVNLSTLIELSELSDENMPFEKNRFFKQMPVLRKHGENKQAAQKFLNGVKNSIGAKAIKSLNKKNNPAT